MSLSSIPRRMRRSIAERDRGHCRYCHLIQFGQGSLFHVNHVVPRSKGGETALDNLVLQCPHCSLHKSNTTDAVDPETGQRVSLFHPLSAPWEEHFILQPDGRCAGRTPVGRATVHALRMNEPLPRTARAVQIMLGLM